MGMPVITPSAIPRTQAVTDINQSVALEDAALSNFLHAQGENVHNMASREDVTAEALLASNKSVTSMGDAMSGLEMALQSTLALSQDYLCPRANNPMV